MVEAVEADRDAINGGRLTANLPELVELRYVADTLRTWSTHRVGKGVVNNLSDPDTYAHNVLVLSAYRLLHTWGNNAIELVRERPDQANCDLHLLVDATPVGTELKARRELREPRYLTAAEAERIAEHVMKKSRRQRHAQSASLLLVGGFQVPDASLVRLATALERELEKSNTRSNVMAAVVITVGRHLDDLALTVPGRPSVGDLFAQFAARLSLQLFQMGVAVRVGRNRRYAGAVPMLRFQEPGVGLHIP